MIAGLYRRTGPLLTANFGALILLTASLWGQVQTMALVAWATALGAWTLVRFLLARLYLRQPRGLDETPRWVWTFAAGATIAGMLWGSSVIFVDELEVGTSGLISAFLMAALSAAAISGYTNSLPAFAGFLVPSLTPFALRLVYLGDEPSGFIALFVLFWGALLGVMARHMNAGFRETLALSIHNRNLAEDMRRERDRAEEASRAKTRFLGHMSHELRTPLNAIIGYSEMMVHRVFGPLGAGKYEEYAADIQDSGRRLLGFFEKIMKAASLEADSLDIRTSDLDLSACLKTVTDRWQAEAGKDEPVFTTDIPEEPAQVCSDPDKLDEVLDCLLSHAVSRAGTGGRVSLGVEDDGAVCRITIWDSGHPMTDAERSMAATPFAVLDSRDHLTASDTAEPDHGPRFLDLPLACLLAERMGHGCRLENAPQGGVRVTLDIRKSVRS